jgi:hypothetical protein
MKRFCEWCTKAKIVAIEAASLAGFLIVLGFMIYFEFRHLVTLTR